MPIITSSKTQPEYDVVIVGSGAGGGQMAFTLTLAGLKVAMLEAGRNYDPGTETAMFQRPDQMPLGGNSTSDKHFGFPDATVDGGWEVPGEPYTQASDKPEERFMWWRPRMLGGRTNHWGRISLRNGDYDFKPRTRDGLGFDWPIGYADVDPFYTKVESLIGVFGKEGDSSENNPTSPPGVLLPPPKGRAAELVGQKSALKLGIPMKSIHRAVLTRPLDADRIPAKLFPGNDWAQKIVGDSMRARAACFWATSCGRGCSIKANYQSTTVHLPPALATGNLDIIPNAHAREIILGADGRATGVLYIDKTTGQEARVKGKAVVLAASSGETVRILLNSKSGQFPQGVANRSGLVGKYIMDTVGTNVGGHIPALEGLPPHNEDGAGGAHMYIPWWLYKDQLAGKLGFARGYHVEVGGGRGMPGGHSPVSDEFVRGEASYGTKFKEAARHYFGAQFSLSCRGEMIPNEESYADLDPEVKDKWGIPVMRWHWRFSEHEKAMCDHAAETFTAIIEGMGGKVKSKKTLLGRNAMDEGGKVIHEVGGALMGDDAAKSVCNSFNQTWDVKNLFLADGSPFPSNADKNPTLTIMALAWRNGEHLIEEARKGNL